MFGAVGVPESVSVSGVLLAFAPLQTPLKVLPVVSMAGLG